MFTVGFTIRWGDRNEDLLIELDEMDAAASFIHAIGERLLISGNFHLIDVRRDIILDPAISISDSKLRWGDVFEVVLGASPYVDGRKYLRRFGSPQLDIALSERREFIVGREPSTSDILLEDESVSRKHASIKVSDISVEISDLDSSNGTLVNGKSVTTPTRLRRGDIVEIGAIRFEFDEPATLPLHGPTPIDGLISVNRPPRSTDVLENRPLALPSPPTRPHRVKIPIVTFFVPLVGAGAAYAINPRQPTVLLFGLLSPIGYIANSMSRSRVGGKTFRVEREKFEQLLSTRSAEGHAYIESYQKWAQRRWPNVCELSALVKGLGTRLWWRRPNDGDFLDIRLGTQMGDVPIDIKRTLSGDDELRAEVDAVADDLTAPKQLPMTLNLGSLPVIGIVADKTLGSRFIHSLAAQLVVEHSHRDVRIFVVAPGDRATFPLFKWLPHVSADGDANAAIATLDIDETSVMMSLQRQKASRSGRKEPSSKKPHLVLFVRPPLSMTRSQVSDFLSDLQGSGISVIWWAHDGAELPGECNAVVEIVSDDSALVESSALKMGFAPEFVEADVFEEMVRDISPLRDASASSGEGVLPDSVGYLDLIRNDELTSEAILRRWSTTPTELSAIVGVNQHGLFSLNLDLDGPHALVAGTTGSGKSEFLRTFVSSIALSNSPEQVVFLLVDYKGGSAFLSCKNLPHCVGMVTDLDNSLAERAIRSLNAELRRREAMITHDAGAKDLEEYRRLRPETPCPSLLIVIDEFAFLVKELPDFVERLVDIAQRGRSLGVHLILATQRPSGVISPAIQANTNLRVGLRVTSSTESNDVLGSPEASTISPRTKGRAFIRSGPQPPVEVQTAYISRPHETFEKSPDARAITFAISRKHTGEIRTPTLGGQEISDLDIVVGKISDAVAMSNLRISAPPWLEPLPTLISSQEIKKWETPVDSIHACAVVDLPDLQAQAAWAYDHHRDQSVAFVGGPRSGKTGALVAVARSLPSESSAIYCIDFGHGGLSPIQNLENCGGVANPQNLEKVCRLISLLGELAMQRQTLLPEMRDQLPTVYCLIDNWPALLASLQPIELAPYGDRLIRLVADARGSGIYFLLTADRAGAFSATVLSGVGTHFYFRTVNPDDAGNSVRRFSNRLATLTPGRAIMPEGTEIQFVRDVDLPPLVTFTTCTCVDVLNAAGTVCSRCQKVAPAPESVIGRTMSNGSPILRMLPEIIPFEIVDRSSVGDNIVVGLNEGWGQAIVNFRDASTFLVAGKPRSGKSSALAAIACGIHAAGLYSKFYLIASRRTPLSDLGLWSETATGSDQVSNLLDGIMNEVNIQDNRTVIIIDDADEWTDFTSPLTTRIEDLFAKMNGHHGIVAVSTSISKCQRTYSGWLATLKSQQHGLLLGGGPDSADVFQLRLPRPLTPLDPPGRGYLSSKKGVTRVQVALHEEF